MNAYYRMKLEVTHQDREFTDNEINEITDIFRENWDLNDLWTDDKTITIEGDDNLSGSEEDFLNHLSEEIWKELGYFVEIQLHAAYLENPPTECYQRDADDYVRIMKKSKFNEHKQRMLDGAKG